MIEWCERELYVLIVWSEDEPVSVGGEGHSRGGAGGQLGRWEGGRVLLQMMLALGADSWDSSIFDSDA